VPVPPRRLVTAITGVRRAFRACGDALVPPEIRALELLSGVSVTHLVAAFTELGLPDTLAHGPVTTSDLASGLDLDADALDRLLRAAAVYGLCRYDRRGEVRLTRLGKVLRTDHPVTAAGMARYLSSPAVGAAWAGLADSVRSGESAFPKVHGASVWQWLSVRPERERDFNAAMGMLTTATSAMIVAAYDWPRGAVVCDVGGGPGVQLIALLARRRDLSGVLIESPGMAARAQEAVAVAGLSDRCHCVSADIFVPLATRADVYLLKDVLHAWDDERCAVVLANVAAAMPVGSTVVLAEITERPATPNRSVPLVDLQMLTQSDGGRQRSVARLQELLGAAGLTPVGTRNASVHTLVLARK
jgi:hypothetical protein